MKLIWLALKYLTNCLLTIMCHKHLFLQMWHRELFEISMVFIGYVKAALVHLIRAIDLLGKLLILYTLQLIGLLLELYSTLAQVSVQIFVSYVVNIGLVERLWSCTMIMNQISIWAPRALLQSLILLKHVYSHLLCFLLLDRSSVYHRIILWWLLTTQIRLRCCSLIWFDLW